jgi:glycine hydroxymethyltransferase
MGESTYCLVCVSQLTITIYLYALIAVGVALKEASSPQFKQYQQQVVANAKALCAALQKYGYTIVSGM